MATKHVYIDTLKAYKEYVSAGFTEEEALAAVSTLNESFEGVNSAFDGVATKEFVSSEINSLETHLESYILRINGGAIVIGILFPVFLKILNII